MSTYGQTAVLRSYVNVAGISGRSCGAPLGGLLADAVGWRWYVSSLFLPTAAIQAAKACSPFELVGNSRLPSLIDVLVGHSLVKSRWPSSLVFLWLGNLSLSQTAKGMKVVVCLAPAVPRCVILIGLGLSSSVQVSLLGLL